MKNTFLSMVLAAIVVITNVKQKDRLSIFLTDAGLILMVLSALLITKGVLKL